jgi:hypothetical protein
MPDQFVKLLMGFASRVIAGSSVLEILFFFFIEILGNPELYYN